MILCSEPVEILAGVVTVSCAASYVRWTKTMFDEVNALRPPEQRVELQWASLATLGDLKQRWRQDQRAHVVWDEHVRLFPRSRKPLYAAVSYVLFLLIPVLTLSFCLLMPGNQK
jgi:hypothetical protein